MKIFFFFKKKKIKLNYEVLEIVENNYNLIKFIILNIFGSLVFFFFLFQINK